MKGENPPDSRLNFQCISRGIEKAPQILRAVDIAYTLRQPSFTWPPMRLMFKKSPFAAASSAFSLVEVTVAIGIVTFCLLALVGLLPVGLSAVKESREEAAAANALEMIAGSIRKATVTSNGVYSALGAYSGVSWTNGNSSQVHFSDPDNPISQSCLRLSLSGVPATNDKDSRLTAYLSLTAPSATNTGNALLTVAWPHTARWTGNAWTNAQGSVSTWLVFLGQ